MKITCPCQMCNGKIEWDTAENTKGDAVTCPHCSAETELFQPVALQSVRALQGARRDTIEHTVTHIHKGSVQTRGADDARQVKIWSAVLMVVGVIGVPLGAALDFQLITIFSVIIGLGGFFGFVVGRFME